MVEIEAVPDEESEQQQQQPEPQAKPEETTNEESPAPSPASSRAQERLDDADEILRLSSDHATRPSVQAHLENLASRLRKEGLALQRVGQSQTQSQSQQSSGASSEEKKDDKPAAAAAAAVSDDAKPSAAPSPPPPKHEPVRQPPKLTPMAKYIPIDTFAFDAGSYGSPTVTVYVPLTGIGRHDPTKISCDFTSTSFDLVVTDFEGKNYRLFKDNLDKDIDPETSKRVIKNNKIILKLGKIKSDYGSYDMWTDLTSKKKKKTPGQKDNPSDSIMEMMKDMYDSGDDNMKKMIGETMMKQRRGELDKPDFGKGLDGGLGDDF